MTAVGWILTVEQLLLALFIAEPDSLLRTVYLISSAVMLCFAVCGMFFIDRRIRHITIFHELMEMSFAFFGMTVAIGRYLISDTAVLSVPVIYIAVLYGVAVIFVFNLHQGVFLYATVTVCALVLLPSVHPEIRLTSYRSDIITNGIIAAVVLYLNSRKFIASFKDKKEVESVNAELRDQSVRDGLTRLYNRRKLDEVLSEVILKAGRYETDFSLILIDLDYFKQINDNHGHHIGDSVLVGFSRILESSIREVDVCGRWGGEEFLVICQETSLQDAGMLAERLRKHTEAASLVKGIAITASFGIASWSECFNDDLLFKLADERLYKAKEHGRNVVVSATAE